MSDNIEEKAKGMGWMPQEDWKGDPDMWRPAEEFVKRGENYIPILKDRIRKLERDQATYDKAMKSELKKVHDDGYAAAKRDYEKQIKDLKEKQFKAVEAGDTEQYNKVEKEISSIKPPEQTKTNQEVESNPIFEDWNSKNPWYAKDMDDPGDADRELTLYANAVSADILRLKGDKMPPEEFYGEIEKRVRATFPDKFTNQRRNNPDIVSGGENQEQTSKKKTWKDLPSEAKSAFHATEKRMKALGVDYKKETYIKEYFEEE